MPIVISCQQCGKTLRAQDEHAGKQVKCPDCSSVLTLPNPGPPVPSPPITGQPSPSPPISGPPRPTGGFSPSSPMESSPAAQRYSLKEFVAKSLQQDRGHGVFELESPRTLEVNLNGSIMTKAGSMIAYVGNIKFTREGLLDKGAGKMFKKFLTGEGARLTKAEGQGRLYLADSGKKIHILQLQNESMFVNGNDLLALENSIDWDIKMMKQLTAVMAGGLFNVRLEGTGLIAITTHYEPLTLRVSPGQPVTTDPNATVAWSGGLSPEFRKDFSLKTFVGRGSGESIQMHFEGDGFVVIQPFEEGTFQGQTT